MHLLHAVLKASKKHFLYENEVAVRPLWRCMLGFFSCLGTLWQFKLTGLSLNLSLAHVLWWRMWFDFWDEFVRILTNVYFQHNMVFTAQVFCFFSSWSLNLDSVIWHGKLTHHNVKQISTITRAWHYENEPPKMNTEFLESATGILLHLKYVVAYGGRIFMNLLYKNVFLFLRRVCLRVILWGEKLMLAVGMLGEAVVNIV